MQSLKQHLYGLIAQLSKEDETALRLKLDNLILGCLATPIYGHPIGPQAKRQLVINSPDGAPHHSSQVAVSSMVALSELPVK